MGMSEISVNRALILAGVAGLAIAAAAPASAAVTFAFAQVSSSAEGSLVSGSKSSSNSSEDQSSTLPPLGLSADAASTVNRGPGPTPDHADATSSVSATFSPDAASGEFIFAQTTDLLVSLPSSLSADTDVDGDAFYDFTLTTPGVFSLNYTLNSTGLTGDGVPPSQAFSILSFSTFSFAQPPTRLTASGTYTSPVLAAGDYQFEVSNFDVNFSHLDDVGAASTSLNSDFAFSITSVPEPATWTMMLIGAGLCGGSLRKRRETPSLRA